jgi:hypothetical protein
LVASVLASVTSAMVVIEQSEANIRLSSFAVSGSVALVILVAAGTWHEYRGWDQKLRRVRADVADTGVSADLLFAALVGRRTMSFWRSPGAWAVMVGAANFSAWIGMRFGIAAESCVGLGLLGLAWAFVLGSFIAQQLLRKRHGDVYAVQILYLGPADKG